MCIIHRFNRGPLIPGISSRRANSQRPRGLSWGCGATRTTMTRDAKDAQPRARHAETTRARRKTTETSGWDGAAGTRRTGSNNRRTVRGAYSVRQGPSAGHMIRSVMRSLPLSTRCMAEARRPRRTTTTRVTRGWGRRQVLGRISAYSLVPAGASWITIATERGRNADRTPLRQHPTPQGEHERMRCIASMNHSHKSKHQKYQSSVGMDASVGNRAPGLVPFVVCVGGRLHWEARRFIDELFGEHPDELRRLKMRIARIMAIFQGRVAKEARARWEEALYAACHEG